MTVITLPDGARASFPDDMPHEEITDVLGAYHHFSERMGIDEVAAMGEIALVAGTGTYGAIAGGLAGLRERLHGGVGGETATRVREDRTYQPRTEAGQRTMQAIGQGVTSVIETLGLDGVAKWWREDAVKTLQEHAGITGGAAIAAFGIGALATMLEISPIPGGKVLLGGGQRQRGMFGGTNAKTADLEALEQAKVLEEHGADRDQIWKDTGWMHDRDGQWKFEIDDSGATFDQSARSGGLGDFSQHPELYDAYPDVKGVQTNTTDDMTTFQGRYSPGRVLDERITVGIDAEPSILLHETQHAIQRREGFAKGGTPTNVGMHQYPDGGKWAEWQVHPLQDELYDLRNGDGIRAERAAENAYYREHHAPVIAAAQERIKAQKSRGEMRPAINELTRLVEAAGQDIRANVPTPIQDRLKVIHEEMGPKPPELKTVRGETAYRRLAGEAEARNVETRMNMTADERRATPPWHTLDVPEDELIVRMQNSGSYKEI